jgi:hypothetical protein
MISRDPFGSTCGPSNYTKIMISRDPFGSTCGPSVVGWESPEGYRRAITFWWRWPEPPGTSFCIIAALVLSKILTLSKSFVTPCLEISNFSLCLKITHEKFWSLAQVAYLDYDQFQWRICIASFTLYFNDKFVQKYLEIYWNGPTQKIFMVRFFPQNYSCKIFLQVVLFVLADHCCSVNYSWASIRIP